MYIIKNKKILKSFGNQIDQLNTLTGGISMAQFKVTNKPDKMVVTVLAPSVSPDLIQVQVEYNKLMVYATLPLNEEYNTEQPSVNLPLFAQVIDIPFHVDVDQIQANYRNGKLHINLPFTEGRLNNRRSIQIEQE
ncbi:Hsp20/alpha crystallin family protein [Adhaeribacter rhizoryzae]|uniref:Hsp20/alpha crystallin family protein n=1 Tax=Adhaeribacter rhizoryzae TaxID=2607907 RepID=A0A5M6DEB4_9BACT|nr:Hsp20/alpha crystallin family protein [Adhaeribacter rhizoryzae]KAA5545733.1 Hsp20/alpha crystallin family protein [Adhaeribacter rhizoryzae]